MHVKKNKITSYSIILVLIVISTITAFPQVSFTPKDITGLKLWLTADSGIVLNGNQISQWQDLSGNNNHAIQNKVASQPMLVNSRSILNNKPVIRFNGVNNFMEIFDNSSLDFTTGMEIFLVIKQNTLAANQAFLAKWDYPTQGSWALQTGSASGKELLLFVANSLIDGGDNAIASTNANLDTLYHIFSLLYDSSQVNKITLFKNASTIFSVITKGSITSSLINSSATLKIGMFGGVVDRFYNGDFAEIIIYNSALSNSSRKLVEEYLNNKYAPPINLGSDKLTCSFPYTLTAKKDYFTNYLWQDNSTGDSLVVNSSGTYSITVTNIFGKTSSDTIVISQDTSTYTVNLGNDTTLCFGQQISSIAGPSHLSYKWSTGATDNFTEVKTSGTYNVSVTDCKGKTTTDSIKVTIRPSSLFDFGNDTTVCYNQPYTLNTKVGNAITYLWSNNSNDSLLPITKSGKYWLTIKDSFGCSYHDTIKVQIDSSLYITSLGPDTSLCVGNTISLKSGASGVQSYLWNDGSTKSALSIQTAGQYWVKAVNGNGCIKRDTITIAIKGLAPTPLFSTDSITCQKNQIQFTDSSTVSSGSSIVNWKWNLGDTTISNLQNPTHIYADSGTYAVSLTVTTNKGCSNMVSKNITINPLPTVDFSNTGACSKANIQLNDLSIVIGSQLNNWNWNFGDTASGTDNNSTLQNPIHLYNDSGNYNIQLIVKSADECIDSITKTIYIKPAPIANFTSTLGCRKEPVTFTNTSIIPAPETISNRSWDFHNGKTSTLPNPKQTYSSTGAYDVTLKITASNGCSSDTTKTININDKPFADYTFNNNCLNSASIYTDMSTVDNDSIIKWNWRFSNSDISLLQNPSYTFKDTGNYPVRLLVVSSAGCADSVTKKVPIKPLPIADFSFNPMFGDSPLNVNFTNQSSGASSYIWNFGDGDGDENGDSLSSNPVHLFQDTGRYTIALTAIDNKGCFSSATQLLQVSPEFIDIALLDVKTTIDNNNYLSISIGMLNMGTRPINYVELLVKADGNLAIKETWNGTLNTGEYTTYNFNSSIQLAKNNSYVCISLVNPNFTTDDNPNNNEQCLPLQQDAFMVPNPYPNPVADKLTIPVIVPSDGEVEISLVDFKADIVINKVKLNALKGFNRIIFNTSNLEEGVYIYTVRFNGEETIKRFVKIGI